MATDVLTQSYARGQWIAGSGEGRPLVNAVNGEILGHLTSNGVDFKAMVDYAKNDVGPALRSMTIHERARMIKELAIYLDARKDELYALSLFTGATRRDSWNDIDGGIITMRVMSSKARREMYDLPFHLDGPTERLSRQGTFVGRHVMVPKQGVTVAINAFNFPVWGLLEKMAPAFIAGVPTIAKPGTPSAFVASRLVQMIIESNILPDGAVQLIMGGVGDLFDHLDGQDSIFFTGSLATGVKLKSHENVLRRNVTFSMEADSLNLALLGPDATPDSAEFKIFVKEVANELVTKTGQRCTCIRRTIVPDHLQDAVVDALRARLEKVVVGDPADKATWMGPLVSLDQRKAVLSAVDALKQGGEIVWGGDVKSMQANNVDPEKGAFFPVTLLRCADPLHAKNVHDVEAFGPVTTIMGYKTLDEAVTIAKQGGGSLVGSLYTADGEFAHGFMLGAAAYHGRLHVVDAACAAEQTGHGSPLPHMMHGGPGRAGGGEELGGIRAIQHHMQRTAVQGSPQNLFKMCQTWFTGAQPQNSAIHPFRKLFEDIEIGDSLLTHRRTVTEADIVNFASLSGDHFYAHVDDVAARESLFGARVAHGYLVLALASGLFVDPGLGPVQANLGIDTLRFTGPVYIGDTIQVRLTATQKSIKTEKDGIVKYAVEVTNQWGDMVADYVILTQVSRKPVSS